MNTTKRKTRPIPSLVLLAAAITLQGCGAPAPVIHSIYPEIGTMGEPITIVGSFFGGERDASFVTIGGAQPTGTAYIEWQENRIRVRVPDFGDAGLVFVHVNGRRSNGVLFANREAIPRTPDGGRQGLGPAVSSVSPNAGAVGSTVTITGSGFGNSRGSGGGFFSRDAGRGVGRGAGHGAGHEDSVEVSEADFGYEMWSDREIRVRVPDGAASGNVEVRTARGRSPPVAFWVEEGPGTKTFAGRRSFVVTYSVNIRTGGAEEPNALHLWVPFPVESAAQRNAQMLFSSPEPFIRDYFGTSLYRLENLEANSGTDVSLSWTVDVYGVRTLVNPQAVRGNAVSPLRDAHTRACPRLPADDPRVAGLVASILGGETNPYLQARRIYDWMLAGNIAWGSVFGSDVLSVLETRRADPFLAALFYSTLLRAAGVPSLPVAGVLVGRDRQTINHHWAEFWIDGLGWIPVDPAMGAGQLPEAFSYVGAGEAADFFFGNVDGRRIAFSRGFTDISQMDPRGRTVTHQRSYALQTLWEEAIGGIDSYTSLWGNIIITGMDTW